MSVEINVKSFESVGVRPSKLYGISHGRVFQMHDNGIPQKTYFVGTGCNDRVMMI